MPTTETKQTAATERPLQPIYLDSQGIARFRENSIVRFILDNGTNDMNRLARLDFTDEDREQFAQLIGYSVSGFGDLSYVSPETVAAADAIVEQLLNGLDTANRIG